MFTLKEDDDKKGGIIPILPILAGITALAGLTGAVSGVAKNFLDKRTNDMKQEEDKRHNMEMEKIAKGDGLFLNPWKGYGMSLDVKDFVNGSDLDDIGKKSLRNILKNLSTHFKIEKKGKGLFLSPYSP
jgi:hypothetical protein